MRKKIKINVILNQTMRYMKCFGLIKLNESACNVVLILLFLKKYLLCLFP